MSEDVPEQRRLRIGPAAGQGKRKLLTPLLSLTRAFGSLFSLREPLSRTRPWESSVFVGTLWTVHTATPR